MTSIFNISILKVWLSVFLTVSVFLVPMVNDIHLEGAVDRACATDIVTSSVQEQDQDQDGKRVHEHHAHSCGSCHLHVLGLKYAGIDFLSPIFSKFVFGSDTGVLHAKPLKLFRPPRV